METFDITVIGSGPGGYLAALRTAQLGNQACNHRRLPQNYGNLGNLEMLFIHNEYRGKGCGKSLFQFMDETKGIIKVDVNEQNYQAIEFYEKLGFRKVGRSEKDGSGKDYPIIHMLR